MVTSGTLPIEWLARRLAQIVEGPHPWGSVQSSFDRRGTATYRLTVYPPGISAAARLRVRLWRGMPTLGFALLLPTLLIGHTLNAVAAVSVVIAASYAGFGLLLFRAASPERSQVRELWALGGRYARSEADVRLRAQLEDHLHTLCRAEVAHAGGRLDAASWQGIWADVYGQISDTTNTPTRRR